MQRPSSTAETMVAKLSSARIMSAACLDTSVPVMPMATPMAACCSAGASFTPSPVMAGTSPSCCSILTSFCLSCGSVRQKIRFPERRMERCSCSDSLKKSAPRKALRDTSSSRWKMLTSRPVWWSWWWWWW